MAIDQVDTQNMKLSLIKNIKQTRGKTDGNLLSEKTARPNGTGAMLEHPRVDESLHKLAINVYHHKSYR